MSKCDLLIGSLGRALNFPRYGLVNLGWSTEDANRLNEIYSTGSLFKFSSPTRCCVLCDVTTHGWCDDGPTAPSHKEDSGISLFPLRINWAQNQHFWALAAQVVGVLHKTFTEHSGRIQIPKLLKYYATPKTKLKTNLFFLQKLNSSTYSSRKFDQFTKYSRILKRIRFFLTFILFLHFKFHSTNTCHVLRI